jgi:hypothetical protein
MYRFPAWSPPKLTRAFDKSHTGFRHLDSRFNQKQQSSTPAHLFLRCDQRSLLRIQLLLLLLEHLRARLRASLQCLIINLEVEQLQATQQTACFRLQRLSVLFREEKP